VMAEETNMMLDKGKRSSSSNTGKEDSSLVADLEYLRINTPSEVSEKWKDHKNIVLCVRVHPNENKGHISCPKYSVLIFSFCISVICMSGIQTSCWG